MGFYVHDSRRNLKMVVYILNVGTHRCSFKQGQNDNLFFFFFLIKESFSAI